MKQLILLLTVYFTLPGLTVHGQTMTSFFRQLPIDWTPSLSTMQKDSLLQKGDYVIPGGDSLNTSKYSVDTSSSDYLRCEYYFTTGQKAFIRYELRRFTKTDGKQFIVYSKYGGMEKAYSQVDLKIFYIVDGRIKEDANQKLLPNKVPIKEFLKQGAPAFTKTDLQKVANDCYDLSPEVQNHIVFRIAPNGSTDFEQWILGYTMSFTWNGSTFKQKLITEE